jgi:hypothetical protein
MLEAFRIDPDKYKEVFPIEANLKAQIAYYEYELLLRANISGGCTQSLFYL